MWKLIADVIVQSITLIIGVSSNSFLGEFAKLRKANFSVVVCVCPSVLSSSWKTRLQLDEFSCNLIFDVFFFLKSVQKFRITLKSDKTNRYFTWRTVYIYDSILDVCLTCIIDIKEVEDQLDATITILLIFRSLQRVSGNSLPILRRARLWQHVVPRMSSVGGLDCAALQASDRRHCGDFIPHAVTVLRSWGWAKNCPKRVEVIWRSIKL